MTISQASAMLAPAPAATPLTAAITGIGRVCNASTSGLVVVVERLAEVDALRAGRDRAIAEVLARRKNRGRRR